MTTEISELEFEQSAADLKIGKIQGSTVVRIHVEASSSQAPIRSSCATTGLWGEFTEDDDG